MGKVHRHSPDRRPVARPALARVTSGACRVRLKISKLPTLAEEGGSMRFNAGPVPPHMMTRGGARDEFYAMSVICRI